MFRRIKDTIAIFLKTNRRLVSPCLVLIAFFALGYFSIQDAKALNNCTSSSVLNTSFPPNVCEPVACQSLDREAKNPDNVPGYNCYYAPLGTPLRPCKTFYSSSIQNPEPRKNCADIIDLPLCSVFPDNGVSLEGISCVKEAKDVNGTGIRGVDYALHNKDSVRFCGTAGECKIGEQCNNAAMASCSNIKCHQLTANDTPNSTNLGNCSILPCNLISIEELKVTDARFDDGSKKYCDGSNVKCHSLFNNDPGNLQYIKYLPTSNTMCQLHNCKPMSPTCDPTNDFDNIFNKSANYKAKYEEYITIGNSISQFCKQLVCKPITQKQYRCTPIGDENPTTLNTGCDPLIKCNTGEFCPGGTKPQVCSGGYCIEVIDCNLTANDGKPENDSRPECFPASIFDQDSTTPDLFNAWFYRPTPPNKCRSIKKHECSIPDTPAGETKATVLNASCDPCSECQIGEACPAVSGCGSGQKIQTCDDGFCNEVSDCGNFLDNNGFIKKHFGDALKKDGMNREFCYDLDEIMQMNDGSGNIWGRNILGVYWHYLTDGNRFGQMCDAPVVGSRMPGYGGIAGNNLNIYKNPDENSSYIKGVATTNYLPDGDAEYKISGCLRYVDGVIMSSGAIGFAIALSGILPAGKRSCQFNIAKSTVFDWPPIQTQSCGYDVCLDMKLLDSDTANCSMKIDNGIFDNSSHPNCISSAIDGDVRMRVKKYSNRRLCVLIDHKGAFAYNKKNFDGKEVLSDGTCIDGTKASDDVDCNGKDTNDDETIAHVWRTVGMVKYIGNALGSGASKRGYIDIDGAFYPEQECAKVPMRIGPSRFYNIAISANSGNLFEPPLYTINSRIKRGGQISNSQSGGGLGSTDLFFPEVEIGYGVSRQKMSLGIGFLGGEATPEVYPLSPSQVIIESSQAAAQETPYSANIFIKKEYNLNLQSPILRLYRNSVDDNGVPVNPIAIGYVLREKSEISSISGNDVNMKVLIRPDSSNTFSNAKLKLKLIADYGVNGQNDDCSGDDICSSEYAVFENENTNNENCHNIEENEFCSRRDSCSALTYECAKNEIDLNNAINGSGPTTSFLAIRENCNNVLLPACNRKLGIVTTTASDFFAQADLAKINNSNNTTPKSILNSQILSQIDPQYANAYGWFSEICINTKSFRDGSKKVIAHKTVNGVMGKCLIDTAKSLYLNDNNSSTNCSYGGKAPYCACVDYVEGMTLNSNEEARQQTSREAGLCLDIPMPKICGSISYNNTNDIDVNGDAFSSSSVQNAINGLGIHSSHTNRTVDGSAYNHAEYSSAIAGTEAAYGQCKGFWKYQTNASGANLKPSLGCDVDGSWIQDPSNNNACIRYSCPAVNTSYSDSSEIYYNNYAIGEEGDNRGLRHGFAIWPQYTKTNDSLENFRASRCIVGYKSTRKDVNDNEIFPSRYCTQLGDLQNGYSESPLTDQCVRKTCSAQTIASGTLSSNPTTQTQIQAWNNNGGAEFLTGKASRSATKILDESIVFGTCNADLGFYHFPNTPLPSRECDSDGNWGPVKNHCVVNCAAIGGSDAENAIHGFATWNAILSVPFGSSQSATGSCLGSKNYIPNPYNVDASGKVLFDGENISYNTSNGLSTGSPIDPTRECSSFSFNGQIATAWQGVVDPCINQCPSITQNVSTSAGKVAVTWPATNFGGTATYLKPGCADTINASIFAGGNSNLNKCYYLTRSCGNDGKWGAVAPMCVANQGQVGNAKYDVSDALSGVVDSVSIGSNLTSNTCADNYANSGAWPTRQCSYKDSNENVDEVYFKDNGGSDCLRRCSQNYNDNSYTASYANDHPVQGDTMNLNCQAGRIKEGNPNTTCGSNGSWTLNTDDNNTCREPKRCNGNPGLDNFRFECNGANNSGHCFNFFSAYFPFNGNTTMPHGSSQTVCRYNAGLYGIYCHFVSLTVTVSCNDGDYSVNYVNGGNTACDEDTGGRSYFDYGGDGSCQRKSTTEHRP